MEGYSGLAVSMQQFQERLEEQRQLLPVEVWPPEEATPQKRDERITRSATDFWFFDKTYFPPEVHSGGYADPSPMHHEMLDHAYDTGFFDAEIGPRDHAKTSYSIKFRAWGYLHGFVKVGGIYSSVLDAASRHLLTLRNILVENHRIADDFGVVMLEDNANQIRFRTRLDRDTRIISTFSEGRSVRSFAVDFTRPQDILGDDIETRTSPLGAQQVQERIDRVMEAWSSMDHSNRSFTWLGNNFDVRCALNYLKGQQERGLLPAHIRVHHYKAWDNGPAWPQRFNVGTEEELRALLQPHDERDWRGNYQGEPIEESGDIFPRDKYRMYAEVPRDARGVAWCDPNLSRKEKGDTTAMVQMLYSPTEDKYYVRRVRCKSYSGSGELLDDYLDLKDQDITSMGFDGHVAQESTWSDAVRNWCRINQRAYPRLEYRRYRVDDLAKTISAVYVEGRLLFPPDLRDGKEGTRFMEQVFAFSGKRAGKTDDAPDSLICAFELLHERGLAVPRRQGDGPKVYVIPDPISY